MKSQDTILSLDEIRALRQLLKITAIRQIPLNRREIDTIVPNQDKIEQYTDGYWNFDTREIRIRKMDEDRFWICVPLDKHYSMLAIRENYTDYIDWHYSTQINLLLKLLGEEMVLDKLAQAMNQRFEGLSVGQAKAVIMKYIPAFREEGSAMTSTTRTQIHRLRLKLEKYKKLVDSFYPLLTNENATLEEIADKMAPYQKYTQAPYLVNNEDLIETDVNWIGEIVGEITSPMQLQPVEVKSKDEPIAEIEETRKRLLEKGWDPDQSQQDEAKIEDVSVESNGLYYICEQCNQTGPMEVDKSGKIIQPFHHDRPMTLMRRRGKSDY